MLCSEYCYSRIKNYLLSYSAMYKLRFHFQCGNFVSLKTFTVIKNVCTISSVQDNVLWTGAVWLSEIV